MTIPQVLTLVTYGPLRSAAGGIVATAAPPGAPGAVIMRALKRFDGLRWEKLVIALAISAIAARLFWITSLGTGPMLPPISLVPARITTAFGLSAITSG